MKKKINLIILLIYSLLIVLPTNVFASNQYKSATWWDIQSIDTMKYSRDLAREKKDDKEFLDIINQQISLIKQTGATHIAIGTPYDEEFIPFLEKWVNSAREHNLKVWFRGNFSGWEGWFDYPNISEKEHSNKIEQFILLNQHIFQDGDIFEPCPECENGQLGDPRSEVNFNDYRNFLINEFNITLNSFKQINKDIRIVYSMNGDVANLVMDYETTKSLGGIVVIDHYVKDSIKLVNDIKTISEKSGGKIILGEFGAPILDIHGQMSEEEQAEWLKTSLLAMSEINNLIGTNYWTAFGGSTSLWNNNGTEKKALSELQSVYKPKIVQGRELNELGRPIEDTRITLGSKYEMTDKKGYFGIVYFSDEIEINIKKEGYFDKIILLKQDSLNNDVVLIKKEESIFFKCFKKIHRLLQNFPSL